MLEAKGYKAFRGTMRILWTGKPMEEIFGDWIYTPNGFWYCGEYAYPKELCDIVEEGGHWEPDPYHPGYVRCSVCHKSIVSCERLEAEEIKYCQYCGSQLVGVDGDA